MLKIDKAEFKPIEQSDFPEIVERKGVGHPDSVCDAAADACSRALCKYYFEPIYNDLLKKVPNGKSKYLFIPILLGDTVIVNDFFLCGLLFSGRRSYFQCSVYSILYYRIVSLDSYRTSTKDL